MEPCISIQDAMSYYCSLCNKSFGVKSRFNQHNASLGHKQKLAASSSLSQNVGITGKRQKASINRTDSSQNENNVKGTEMKNKELPIRLHGEKIMTQLENNQVVIVVGHTGCGKSTQLPQMLFEHGFGQKGLIACTQPRRFAAISLATRVAKEMKSRLGDLVGFKVRFQESCSNRTQIKYMTDGSLVRCCLKSITLNGFSAIILDEVHERSLQTDILFGLIKRALANRSDLRLILTSATVQSDAFSRYFFNAPIVEVPGRLFDVTLNWDRTWDSESPSSPNFEGIAGLVKKIHRSDDEGDILVFLSGKPDIEKVAQCLKHEPRLIVLQAHAELQSSELDLIHEPAPSGERKVVLATNLAETSLTVDGIVFVIDHGFVKMTKYDGDLDLTQLVTVRCSQAQAEQRRGRAGRTRPGVCYRLYSEELFKKTMPPAPSPEVARVDLTGITLQLKSIYYSDVLDFDFIDRPNLKNVKAALNQLHRLEALDEDCCLTRKGRLMSSYPLEPKFSAALFSASADGCAEDVLLICAMLSEYTGSDLRKLSSLLAPNNDQSCDPGGPQADDLMHSLGESMALRNILHTYVTNNKPRLWCFNYRIDEKKLSRAKQIYDQLKNIMKMQMLHISFHDEQKGEASVIRALLDAGFANIAHFRKEKFYTLARDGTEVRFNPSLLRKGDIGADVIFGLERFKPPLSTSPFLACVTVIPDEVDLSAFRRRFQVHCSHFDPNPGVKEPYWKVDALEWRDKYVAAKLEKEQMRRLKEESEDDKRRWMARCSDLEREVSSLKAQTVQSSYSYGSGDYEMSRLRSEVRQLREEKQRFLRERQQAGRSRQPDKEPGCCIQ